MSAQSALPAAHEQGKTQAASELPQRSSKECDRLLDKKRCGLKTRRRGVGRKESHAEDNRQPQDNATIMAGHDTTPPVLEPDLATARQFLDLLDPSGQYTFQTIADRKGASDGWRLNRVLHGSFDEHADALVSLNILGAGIFVMVNEGDGVTRPGNKTCRAIKNVIRVRSAFVDLDGSPVDPVIEAKVQPSIVVESSPNRWHAYWRLDDCPLGQFKAMQLALAERFGGDPAVNDLCRVMRLPGFIHQKQDPFMTRIVDIHEMKGKQ